MDRRGSGERFLGGKNGGMTNGWRMLWRSVCYGKGVAGAKEEEGTGDRNGKMMYVCVFGVCGWIRIHFFFFYPLAGQ